MATVALFLGSSPTSTSRILETKSGVLQSILFNHFTVLIHFTNSVFWWIKDKFLFFGYQFLGMCLHLSPFQLIQFVFYKLPIPIIVSFLADVFFIYILKHDKLSLEAVQLHEKKRTPYLVRNLSCNIAWIISLRAEIFTKPTKKRKQNCLSITYQFMT